MMHFRIDGGDHDVLADEDVRDLLAYLRSDAACHCPNRGRLVQFFARCAESEGSLSFEKVLQARKRGGISLSKSEALNQRDAMLADLWRSHCDYLDQPPYTAADLMCRSAERYQAGRWVRERDKGIPPMAEPAATWWKILRLGVDIPGKRQLAQILSDAIQKTV